LVWETTASSEISSLDTRHEPAIRDCHGCGAGGEAIALANKIGGKPMLSFARDIRPLFRDEDVEAMRYAFDLGQLEDVRVHAEGIYKRLADGSMPCDVAWPAEHITRFRRWVDEGGAP
jgi:hypothetical protein